MYVYIYTYIYMCMHVCMYVLADGGSSFFRPDFVSMFRLDLIYMSNTCRAHTQPCHPLLGRKCSVAELVSDFGLSSLSDYDKGHIQNIR